MRLVVEGLGHARGAGAATDLNGITFALDAGHMLLVAGPSGSGKTTLLRTLAGLEARTSGEVRIEGTPHTPGDAAALGMVFQTHELFPHLTALENVALALHASRGEARASAHARARAALAAIGVASLADRAPSELSHGQRQRVAIARALALEPKVLLLDEPSASLDPLARRDLLDLVRALLARGLAIVTVSHDFALLDAADRLAILDRGALVEEGETARVLRAPEHPTTRALLDAALGSSSRPHARRAEDSERTPCG